MTEWYPKQHGFESGEAGTRSFNRIRQPHIMGFHEWRAGLLAKLSRENIPVQQMPDGTIIASFQDGRRPMSPELQQENYYRYLDRVYRNRAPFEEGAGLAGY